jgi:hypothetical protein
VADLLAACGYDRDLDGYAAASPLGVWSDEAETYGLNPTDPDPYTAAAARAVAQTRARGGRAGDLLLAIAVAPEVGGTTLLDDVEVLALRLETLRGHGGGHGDDAPLDEVLPTAAEIASGPAITTADLVRAVLVAGGPTPRALLTGEAHGGAPSQRRTDQEQA